MDVQRRAARGNVRIRREALRTWVEIWHALGGVWKGALTARTARIGFTGGNR
jgi:hypothetical protein